MFGIERHLLEAMLMSEIINEDLQKNWDEIKRQLKKVLITKIQFYEN